MGETRVDQNGQRNGRSVGVTGILAAALDGHDGNRAVDLRSGEAQAVGVAHGLDQVVDEGLGFRKRQGFGAQFLGHLPQDGVTEFGDLE
ncbi:hypothetical protein D3C78_1796430 [compost metagenome]